MALDKDKKALKILQALQNNPVGSIQDIVRETTFSHQTISSKLKFMEDNAFLSLKGIRAEINLNVLGLILIEILADTPNVNATKILEYFTDVHHYVTITPRV